MSNPDIRIESNTATLCCGKKNCPQLHLEGDEVVLLDDHGGHVRIKESEARLIALAIDQLRVAGDR
jgi:hypothetical protein